MSSEIECRVCCRWFRPLDEEAELCAICEADEELQREMDRDIE